MGVPVLLDFRCHQSQRRAGRRGYSVPMSRHDEYTAKLVAAFFMAVERARLAPADEVEPLNKLLDEYVFEMERTGEISTEEELQAAWVTARLRGLL
jgi:hypothetical protein